MCNFKYLTIIINFFAFISLSANASQFAIVASSRAIIYSNPDLTGPIGTITKGNKLHAADNILANGKSLPFQLGQKVAFISIDDVITEKGIFVPLDKNPKEGVEHAVINHFESQHENDFTKNNFFAFEFGKTKFLNGDWVKLNEFILGTTPSLAQDISIYAQHRPENLNHYVAIGLNYIYQNDQNMSLRVPMLAADIFYSIIKNSLFSFDLGLSVYGSGDLQIKAGSPNKRFVGSIFGAGPKLNFRLFPQKFIGFHISARYQYYRILNMDNLEIPSVETPITLDEFNNISVLIGMSIQLM